MWYHIIYVFVSSVGYLNNVQRLNVETYFTLNSVHFPDLIGWIFYGNLGSTVNVKCVVIGTDKLIKEIITNIVSNSAKVALTP